MEIFKKLKLIMLYDIFLALMVHFFFLVLCYEGKRLPWVDILLHAFVSILCVIVTRAICRVYHQIWRYGGIQCYIRLIGADALAFVELAVLESVLPLERISGVYFIAIACAELLCALAMRMTYRYAYKCNSSNTRRGRFLARLIRIFAGKRYKWEGQPQASKIKIAIVGAGRVGVTLSEELKNNPTSAYAPICFVDSNANKANRIIHDIPVLNENENIFNELKDHGVQEVVIAIPSLSDKDKKKLYELYTQEGYKTRIYDYPVMQSGGGKRQLRDFDIEELLFRRPISIENERTVEYYKNKVVLITGGGGSIGSELCRQIAAMSPKALIVLDICENGAYDVQQELRLSYGQALDLSVEIASVTNRAAMERVFEEYRPQIVIHAAAHKHVPLMEKNCIEAIENNVFGTKTLVELCEEFCAERFMMVSTDKAVNPTNVMGATKRMCEMIVQSASLRGKVVYSATRFGNVLGSAGSVIPLFRRQIANGGPVTLTDKRIIRYFMTIPEASGLVLESGAMAKNNDLFVLDMGQPVKIYDLAMSMIKLSGAAGVEIIETGLRPGEKLYEELLVRGELLSKTDNDMIFIERDEPLSAEIIEEKLALLREACACGDDDRAREALRQAVPSFKRPEEINLDAENSAEMRGDKILLKV